MATAACCVKNPNFPQWKTSLKFKMLWFFESRHHHNLESIDKIAHFYILNIPGGHFDEKKKTNLFKGCGEKMAITRLILGLADARQPSKSVDITQNAIPTMTRWAWPQVHHTLEMMHIICSLDMFWNHIPNPGFFITQCNEPKRRGIDIRLNKLTTSPKIVHPFRYRKDIWYKCWIKLVTAFIHFNTNGFHSGHIQRGAIRFLQQFHIRRFIIIKYRTQCSFVDLFHFVSTFVRVKMPDCTTVQKIESTKVLYVQLDFDLFIQKFRNPIKGMYMIWCPGTDGWYLFFKM